MKIHCLFDKMVNVHELKPHPKNMNKHPKEQIERLAKILEYQGFRYPIKVSKQSGFITSGHGRLEAAKFLKLTQVPVNYQGYESEAQEYADIVADNAIASWADLDLSAINHEVLNLPDFDLDLLGIEDFKIVEPVVAQCEEDEVPEQVPSVSVLGDMYELGNHRLLCGDSTSIDAVEKLMNNEKADMVFTDPPYGVDYQGGHNEKKRQGIENDKLEGSDLTDLFADAISCAEMVTHSHAAFYIWYANGKAVETFKSFANINLKVRAVICWYKVRSGLGAFMSQYIPNYEPCIYAFKEGHSPQWFGPSDEKTVWELQRESKNEYHPTQKPVGLPERAMTNSSKSGQIILDLFGGSGSTLIACEKTNRKCFMMELDPHYVDVIVSRYVKYSGNNKIKRNGEEIEWQTSTTT